MRKSGQVGPVRRGAGSMPAAWRISHTVDAAMGWPSRASSPWIRLCPPWVLPSQTQHRLLECSPGRRPPGAGAPRAVIPLRRDELAGPGQQGARREGEDLGPAVTGISGWKWRPTRTDPQARSGPGPRSDGAGQRSRAEVRAPRRPSRCHCAAALRGRTAACGQPCTAVKPSRDMVSADLPRHRYLRR